MKKFGIFLGLLCSSTLLANSEGGEEERVKILGARSPNYGHDPPQ